MSASRATTLFVIIGAMWIASSASASPIAPHAAIVAVNPPGHFEDDPLFKKSAAELDDIPDFYKGMDESLLPEGYFVRGQGVVLFYSGAPVAPAVLATTSLASTQPNSEPIVNPEPASLVLLGTGLLIAVRLRRQRR